MSKSFYNPTLCTNPWVNLKTCRQGSNHLLANTPQLRKIWMGVRLCLLWLLWSPFFVCLHHIIEHCLAITDLTFNYSKIVTLLDLCHSFIHSLIHSSFCPFIHSAVRFPSLPGVIYSVELERQAAEYWVISAFLSRHSTAHESLE